jgi:hypothetical protein
MTRLKRHRGSDDENDEADYEATQLQDDADDLSAEPSTAVDSTHKRRRRVHEYDRPMASSTDTVDVPPPLETGAGSRCTTNSTRTPIADAAAVAPAASSLARVVSLDKPLSATHPSFASSTSAAAPPSSSGSVDLRQKTRDMIEQAMRNAAVVTDQSRIKIETCQSPAVDAAEPKPPTGSTAAAGEIAFVVATSSLPIVSVPTLSALATSIESSLLHAAAGELGVAYRQRVRSILFNLRQNASLTHRLVRGDLTPYGLSLMSDKELAPPETQAERSSSRAASLSASIAKSASRLPTREYRCRLCGSDSCSTRVLREDRGAAKADTWGSKQGAGSVIDIRCDQCQHTWTKEE